AGLPGVRITPEHVETNIVVFDIHETGRTAEDMLGRLKAEGLLLVPFGPATLRAVTHLDISNSEIEEACAILKKIFTTSPLFEDPLSSLSLTAHFFDVV